MSILVVDDSMTQRMALSIMLEEEGYEEVLQAGSGVEALALLEDPKMEIDVILLDVEMPEINGIETCRRIKAHHGLVDIPVLMVTATDDIDVLKEAFAVGALDYIVKPPNEAELGARVGSAMKLKLEIDWRKAREIELLEANQKLNRANRALKNLSMVDALTSIANRRYFDEMLATEWRRAKRSEQTIGLLMIDIDHFKAYNDTYGHPAGDECLKKVAARLQESLFRASDLLARYGGEEFAVIMPEIDPNGTKEVGERLRERIESLALEHSGNSVAPVVTISLGAASMVPCAECEPQDLITQADKALYRAKEGGRNQVGG